MIICVDVGNTSIKCGTYDNDTLIDFFVIDTNKSRSSFQYEKIFEPFLAKIQIRGGIISSVVPSLTLIIKKALEKFVEGEIFVLNKTLKTRIPIKIDNPNELGADMLAGAVGAIKKYGSPVVVADLGTATKLYVLSKEGAFIGCVIYCGLMTSLKGLVSNTSQLLEVPLETSKTILGKNTKTSIQSGILNGQVYQAREFANELEDELGYKVERILSGGCSSYIKNKLNEFHYEPYLVLDGLNEIYKINEER